MINILKVLTVCITLLIVHGIYAQTIPIIDKWDNLLINAESKKSVYKTPSSDFLSDINQKYESTIFPLNPEWYWADLGTAIGVGILDSADFDGDGAIELITTGGGENFSPPDTIYILANDLTTVKCTAPLDKLPFDYQIAQLDNDLALEILMVEEDKLVIIDGKTCEIELVREFGQIITSAAIGDVNNDNVLDIVYSLNNHLFVSPWNDFGDTIMRPSISGSKIIANSLGREGGDDIGVLSDDVLYILNGSDLTTIAEINDNLTPMFDFGDVNGDGSYELIQAAKWNIGVTVTNIESNEVLFNFPELNIDAMRIFDIDDDGSHEILVGKAQFRNVYILNGAGEKIIDLDHLSSGTTNLITTDLQNGAGKEMIWGSGHSSSGSDHLYRANLTTETITWRSNDVYGSYQLGVMGEFLNNGIDYIAISYAESRSTYNIGRVSIIDANTGEIQPIEYTSHLEEWRSITSIATGNIDQDSHWEICFSGDNYTTGDDLITCRDALTSEVEWSVENPNGFIYQLEIMDIDNDLLPELIAMSETGYINAYDASTGSLKWQSPQITNELISWGFGGMKLIDNSLWITFSSGNLYKLNVENGSILESSSTFITSIVFHDSKIYAVKNGVGVGLLNTTTMDLDNVIYPTTGQIDYLKISDDGKLLLVADSISDGQFNPILISIDNSFVPWHIGTLIYDAYMPNFLQLILTGSNGALSYDLGSLHGHIYNNGFE